MTPVERERKWRKSTRAAGWAEVGRVVDYGMRCACMWVCSRGWREGRGCRGFCGCCGFGDGDGVSADLRRVETQTEKTTIL